MKTKHKDLEKYEKARGKWDDAAEKYSNKGAADTEPQCVLYSVIHRYMKEGKNVLPLSAEQWQLYTCSTPCKRAANALNKATQNLLKVLDSCSYRGIQKISDYYGYDL